ncbi:hypothetical protein ACRALDRAFT_2039171 [Sodiomyces alcalophilus JCM 7366]|uniref:uncharacterized protein n=1 Tax=Sodiomyces alcalophilus JCM 7366 TaxID=591952 RepID=UPI0039B5568C
MDPSSGAVPFEDPEFDVLEWYPHFQSCVRYFLDHAQYDGPIQAFAAFLNIKLPCQQLQNPVFSYKPAASSPATVAAAAAARHPSAHPAAASAVHMPGYAASPGIPAPMVSPGPNVISITPYLRRLVAMGLDSPGILHGFFGDDWVAGIGRLHEVERRNYLFAAKSRPWLSVKDSYDMGDGQYIPYLKPLQGPSEKEMRAADVNWSEWLSVGDRQWKEWMAMEDWVIGPRAPEELRRPGGADGAHIKMEDD